MIRNLQSCFSADDKARYPLDELLLFWTDGETEDSDEVLLRNLFPVSSLEVLTNRTAIYLHSIEFAGYDTSKALIANPDEDSEKEFANEKIFGNMLTSSWQPNYCRPVVRINGVNMASSISTGSRKDIGLPLPYCFSINRVIKEPKSIEVLGSLAQVTPEGYRNYPMLAIINFWHNDK
jgi:hypothetical protein